MRWPFFLDLRAIAVLRIAIGLLILVDLAIRAPDISVFYVANGVCPVDAMPLSHYTMKHLELYRHVDTAGGVALLFALTAMAASSLTLGFYSRTSAAMSWYLITSLQNRNIYLNDGGDLYMRAVLMCALFLPLGARWSVDAWRNPKWRALPNRFISLASATLLIQISIMYFVAGTLKSDPSWRVTGDALYLALSIDQFSTGFAQQLLQHPTLLRVLNFGALAIELSAAFLILCPVFNSLTRTLAVFLLLSFHLGIASTLHLGLFMPICLAVTLVLIPTPVWDWITRGKQPEEPERQNDANLPSGYQLSLPARVFMVSIVVFLVVQNAATVPATMINPGYHLKNLILGYGRSTSLMQNWTLFAPHPFLEDGWFIMEGSTEDGTRIDLMRDGQPVSYAKPLLVSAQFKNQRWRRWYQCMWKRYNPKHVPIFLRWELGRWNREHPQQPLSSIRLIFVEEKTQLPGLPPKRTSYSIGSYPSEWLP